MYSLWCIKLLMLLIWKVGNINIYLIIVECVYIYLCIVFLEFWSFYMNIKK